MYKFNRLCLVKQTIRLPHEVRGMNLKLKINIDLSPSKANTNINLNLLNSWLLLLGSHFSVEMPLLVSQNI